MRVYVDLKRVEFSSASHPNDASVVANLCNLIRRQRTFGRPKVILERANSIRVVDEFRSKYNEDISLRFSTTKSAHT